MRRIQLFHISCDVQGYEELISILRYFNIKIFNYFRLPFLEPIKVPLKLQGVRTIYVFCKVNIMNRPLVCMMKGCLAPVKTPSTVSFFLFPSWTWILAIPCGRSVGSQGSLDRRNIVNFSLTVWLDGTVMIHVQR